MDNAVIVGSSGHARVVVDALRLEGKINVVGLLDRFRAVGEQAFGLPILGREDDLPRLTPLHGLKGTIIAIGDNAVRARVAARVRELAPALSFFAAIHPSASIASDVVVGEGTVVMAGAVVNPGSSIGRFCILNTNSSLDHDSTLGDFASLAPGATTGGTCSIGGYAAIGIRAVLTHGIHIGEHAVVGAGSVVMRSIDPLVVAYGSPARVIRARQPGDPYL